jgi:uncharacterized protein (DUF1330 family)
LNARGIGDGLNPRLWQFLSMYCAAVSVYALNLFDVADRGEYLEYARRSPAQVAAHGGRVVALGEFQEAVVGDIAPRRVLILVEWDSREAFDSYRDDPQLADLHPHRENGSSNYVWHLFDRLDDLRPVLKQGPPS